MTACVTLNHSAFFYLAANQSGLRTWRRWVRNLLCKGIQDISYISPESRLRWGVPSLMLLVFLSESSIYLRLTTPWHLFLSVWVCVYVYVCVFEQCSTYLSYCMYTAVYCDVRSNGALSLKSSSISFTAGVALHARALRRKVLSYVPAVYDRAPTVIRKELYRRTRLD